MTFEPLDDFDQVLDEIHELNRRKRADYASDDDPWSNFKEAARQTGLTPGKVVEVLIAIKQARLKELTLAGKNPRNESVQDTKLDRAVYGIIGLVLERLGLYDEDWDTHDASDS